MTSILTTVSKLSFILILFSLLLIATYPVWAQEYTPGVTRRDRVKEKVATREAALKAKLQAFRDQKKATAAARISENLNKINDKQTQALLKHLDKMTTILLRLEERVNKGTSDIKDPSLVRGAIADAKAAIATATASVNAQAKNDYTVSVSSESKVRIDVKATRDRLHADLRAVRKQVIDAKQAVANAIRVAKSGKVEIPRKEGTPSGR